MRWVKRWWPALVWAAVISAFSTRAFTAENTGSIIIPILHWMFPGFSPDTLSVIHYGIRKCAHFTEYFILSWLILRGIRGDNKVTHVQWALLTIALVTGYAALDEFHQSFVPGRTASPRDVLIDMSGGIAAQVAAALLMLLAGAREHRKARQVAGGALANPNAE
ncbi:MAG TPA: VanZ family protein [Candidatus Micrarchaeaceae archaeon]|nr:VanZ family protein [Candidatus Micrarchaeaceae archaeon]